MAELTCPYCAEPIIEGSPICPGCGGPLLDSTTRLQPAAPAGGQVACPHCGAEIPDPGNVVCIACLEPLERLPPPRQDLPTAFGTRRDGPRTLVLEFAGGRVTVLPGTVATLGRAPEAGATARVFHATDNVSRLHATVEVEPNGAVWICDEESTNGTFVNGSRLAPRDRSPLRDGDTLRLAADVEARVRLIEGDHG